MEERGRFACLASIIARDCTAEVLGQSRVAGPRRVTVWIACLLRERLSGCFELQAKRHWLNGRFQEIVGEGELLGLL